MKKKSAKKYTNDAWQRNCHYVFREECPSQKLYTYSVIYKENFEQDRIKAMR